MEKNLKKLSLVSQRGFYATLVCFMTMLINLVYYFAYDKSPLTLVAIMPIIFWIAYDGNEENKATKKGFWYWILILITTSAIVMAYPLF
ncbi:MAG: hypothetical protein PHT91_00540 [Candidatus Nanoarchaeia archaeon]|nr:hypothetical protein [Candidatus Nanoarchaeia archaeon]MDD5054269.1 hypothetical protein [Candidatus Nanoarchaeia archaeon]MDD5499347.1 hypothetical protein [Candidatus Nanoarchaeia archaeon]